MSALIIMGIIALMLLTLGLFIRKGKGLMLLSGYNTLPKEQWDRIDKQLLSKTMGNLLLRMALCFALLGLSIYYGITWASFALLVAVIADPFVSSIILSRKMPEDIANQNKKAMKIALVISVIVFIGMGFLFYYGEAEPVVIVSNDAVQIKAMYGLEISFSEITDVTLIEQSMREIGVGTRANGYGGFGGTLKGNFSAGRRGSVLLFVKSGASPTLLIEREGGKDVYISFGDDEKTRELYRELEMIR